MVLMGLGFDIQVISITVKGDVMLSDVSKWGKV